MVALVVSTLALVAGISLVFAVGRRRPPGTPVTWGEAFVGGTFIFAMFVLGYGIIPHQWLTFADNQLLWRPDKLMLGISGDGVKLGAGAKTLGGTGRIIVNAQAVRDMVAAVIYIVFLGIQIYLWAKWQKRGRKAPDDIELRSRFGRPVMRKA